MAPLASEVLGRRALMSGALSSGKHPCTHPHLPSAGLDAGVPILAVPVFR